MKLTKKLSITVCSLTTALVSTAVITNAYKSVAQTEPEGPELITNGSFEIDPLVDPNDPTAPNPNVMGWNKSEPFNPADTPGVNISGIRISNFPNTGNQGLSLSSIIGSSETSYISQTIPTVKDQNYKLTYYFASTEEAPDVKNKFQIFIGGKKFGSDKNTAFQPYTLTTISFKAKGESTEIKFGWKVKYAFLYLDDVSVKSVPEP
ncbi:hypothetical protein [Halotia branconii]|uniref:CBM-cenC domain-containing protein n=1 Tax=Halotia branconii CENA392 TaxID=1539056 RepID=A0AAJ6NVM6_9CYAN|nr:hypothetical protein [Halotia branconii]WGV27580.1 hypothetical protein QI031_08880 [Halotia branconii CENA392]